MSWRKAWRLLESRLTALSLRERGMILAAALVAMYVVWDLSVLGPLNLRESQTLESLRALGEDRATGETVASTIGDLGARIQSARVSEARAKSELAALEETLSDQTRALITPQRMPAVLRDLLSRQSGLALISLTALPSRPLIAPASASSPGVFVHSYEILLSGDYMSVVDYLRSLESMPWKVYWNRIELQTDSYPRNRVRVVVATLSLESRSLGT